MDEKIKVSVVAWSNRPRYQLQWIDPLNGKKKTKISNVARPADDAGKREIKKALDAAAVEAAAHAVKVEAGDFRRRSDRTTWAEFRERYESFLGGKATKTLDKVVAVFNSLEKHLDPKYLAALDALCIDDYQTKLRRAKKSEATIKGYLAHLKAALRWAKGKKLLAEVPQIDMPTRASGTMKGRAITGEEFERMLAHVENVLACDDGANPDDGAHNDRWRASRRARAKTLVPAWQRFLRGLWLSGLRISEAVNLTWDRDDKMRVVGMNGNRPKLRMPAHTQKNNRHLDLPMAPDFARLLAETPEQERRGRVFRLPSLRDKSAILDEHRVGVLIAKIGKAAKIKSRTDENGKVKFATAHDLRRAFGTRWAKEVSSSELKKMMRYANIATTLAFYVDQDTDELSDRLWSIDAKKQSESNKSGNTSTGLGEQALLSEVDTALQSDEETALTNDV